MRLLRCATIALSLTALHCASSTKDGAPIGNGGDTSSSGGGSTSYSSGGGQNNGNGGDQPSGSGGDQPGGGGDQGSTGGLSGGGSSGAGGGTAIHTDGGTYTIDPIGTKNRAPGFVDLTPPMGAPLDGVGTTLSPAAPDGWTWYNIDGAVCRDNSPAGFFVHMGTTDKLIIYLEGGGACSDDHYCAFNPANVNQILAGNGQTVIGSTAGAIAGRQQPGVYNTTATPANSPQGIHDLTNAANPFKDWSHIYVPYCTGDVFYGEKPGGTVAATGGTQTPPQQFVGGADMKLFIGRIVPTFKSKVSRVVLTGASAGGFGAALNFSMVSDAFGDVPVDVIDDSGPPFNDKYMPVCMQKRWRAQWGFQFPPDCAECNQADGGGLVHVADFLTRKHPKAHIAIISSMQDEVIRLFYSVGLQDCKNYDTADPVAVVLGQLDPTVFFPGDQYTSGLTDLRATYLPTKQLATYFIGGAAPQNTYHQHEFRPEFYDPAMGTETEAQFVTNFLAGTMEQIGP
jgi:hypothetical protein